jgi:hypothetical protein
MFFNRRGSMRQITEWWVTPLDEYGDSIEVYYCDSKREAKAEREQREYDHPDAAGWLLEKVVRRYREDGDLRSEKVTIEQW